MARTSPAPNIPPIPGMCPGVAVLAGNGDGGGGSGKGGKNGKGKKGAGTGDGDEDASGDGANGGEGCGDPVCPITGRMFIEIYDFGFGGFIPLRWIRHYNSRTSATASEVGYGWSHTFGWKIIAKRRAFVVIDERARRQVFRGALRHGEQLRNALGWSLRREGTGFELRLPGGKIYEFATAVKDVYPLTAVRDQHRNRIAIHRGAQGQLLGITDSAGRPYRVETDGLGRIVAIAVATDTHGRGFMEVVRYAYDDAGDLVSATDAENYSARYVYSNHRMVEHRSPSGLSYFYRYDGPDEEAYCVETWGEYPGRLDPALEVPIAPAPAGQPDARAVKGINYARLDYLKSDNYSEVTNGLGGVTRFFGDEAGRVVKRVDPAGGVTQSKFDPASGARAGHSSKSGAAYAVLADEQGHPIASLDQQGGGVLRAFDADGTLVETNYWNGAVVKKRFDRFDSLTWLQHADGTVEEFEYDERGCLKWWRDRQGGGTHYHHDEMGNCIWFEHPNGGVEVSEYDYLGRRVLHYDASSNRTAWEYDRRSEIIRKIHGDGSEIRIARDANRDPVLLEDGGRVTRYEWGGMGWLYKVTRNDGEVREYRYDVEGNQTAMINARGQVYRRFFDVASRCVAFETFEGVRRDVGYVDESVAWIEGPAGREVYEYDFEGRLLAAEAPDGKRVELEYGFGGATRVASDVTLETKNDLVGRAIEEKQGQHKTNYQWSGGQISAAVSDVGLPVAYAYNDVGLVDRITAGRTTVRLQYDQGEEYLTFWGSSLVVRRRYGPTNALVAQTLARYDRNLPEHVVATRDDPNVIHATVYEYDAAQILRREHHSDGRVVEYDLDHGDRVAAKRVYRAGILDREERLAYDAVGSPRLATEFDVSARPIALGNERFEYDELGRLVTRTTDGGEWRYEYDGLENLVRVVAPDREVRMDYDARGRRMRKRVFREQELVSSTSYVWTNQTLIHEHHDLTGRSRTYLRVPERWAPLGHVDLIDGVERPCFYLQNPVEWVDLAVDERGVVVWSAESTVFGDCTPLVRQVDVTLRFPNQFYDEDVELVYNRMRWYDPRLGLYIMPDPLHGSGTFNPRDYVSNPVRFIDPMGQEPRRPTRRPSPGTPGGPPGNHTDRPDRPGDSEDMDGHYMSQPGHWATNGTAAVPGNIDCPASHLNATGNWGSSNDPTSIRSRVDAAGNAYGCHSCGTRDPRGPDGTGPPAHWTPDHQPPAGTYNNGIPRNQPIPAAQQPPAGAVRLYPHCRQCSNSQGGLVAPIQRSPTMGPATAAEGFARNLDPANARP